MERTIYLVLGLVGGGILLLQVLMQVFGLSGDGDFDGGHDVPHDVNDHAAGSHDGSWFFGVLSFKALVAFAGLFGLTGLALIDSGWSSAARVGAAFAAGLGGMFLVALLMRSLRRLTVSGSLDLANAVGLSGSVYLRVPGRGQGPGKVTLEIQGRSMQVEAVTDGPEIPTGARITVVSVLDGDTLKVAGV
jgi:hypothetical protein